MWLLKLHAAAAEVILLFSRFICVSIIVIHLLSSNNMCTKLKIWPVGSLPTAGRWKCLSESLWPRAAPGPCLAGTGDPCRSSPNRTLQVPPWNAPLTREALWLYSAESGMERRYERINTGQKRCGVKEKESIMKDILFPQHLSLYSKERLWQ